MELDPRNYENVAIGDSDTHNIVLSYLVHNCFKETVESFIGCTGIKEPADCLEDIDRRKRIIKFALEYNVLKAIELTEQLAPDLLEENKDLHFDLLSLHFVELVCSRKCTEALEFARTKLTPFGNVAKYVTKLEDFMALLAYEEPEKSPMFHLLSLDYRQDIADNLNRAILAHAKQPSYSSLEKLIQQTTVVRHHLNQEHSKMIIYCLNQERRISRMKAVFFRNGLFSSIFFEGFHQKLKTIYTTKIFGRGQTKQGA